MVYDIDRELQEEFMRERTSTQLGGKIWASLLMCGFIGQVAWVVENMYFATFAQDIFENSPDAGHLYYLVTTLMVVLSALTATVTTIFAGALTDKVGKRKPFISIGYIVWGLTIMLFATIDVDAAADNSTLVIALFVVFDCVMTLVGSTANDAAFNAWVTDVTDGTNRGKVNTILSVMPVIATVAAIAIAMFTYDKGNYAAFFIILGVIPIAAGVVSIFLVKDAPGIVRSDMRTAKDVFYGFRPSVVKSNKMMFVCLTALCLVGISQQTFFSYLINFVQTTLGIADYLLPIGAVIVMSAVITGVLGVFYDKLGRKKFYIPLAAFIVVGTLAIYLTKFLGEGAYLPMLYVGGTVMLGSLLCTNGALMSAFQDYIPDGCEGRFQGVRMCFTVLAPMVIGPIISMAIGINSFDPTDGGAIAPPFEIFLAASIVAVIAIVPIVFVARDADRLRAAKAAQKAAEQPSEHSENP